MIDTSRKGWGSDVRRSHAKLVVDVMVYGDRVYVEFGVYMGLGVHFIITVLIRVRLCTIVHIVIAVHECIRAHIRRESVRATFRRGR